MSEKEKEFWKFIGFCAGEEQKGKTVDEIWKAWQDREKRIANLSDVLNKLTLRELDVLNAALKIAVAGRDEESAG